jgi:PTS system lactose-specific IIC component
MNGFMYTLPWTVPGPIGTIMGLGFQPLAFVMLAIILVVDFALYYPFFRAYDAQKCAEEAEISREELAAKNAEKAAKLNDAFQGKADAKSVAAGAAAEVVKTDAAPAAATTEATAASDLNGKRVLVLCQGGGTSGLLANALAKAAKERGIDLETAADAYGNHVDMLPDFDLVVLAPQAASYLADLQKDCERVGNKCVACRGKQYIELSQNGDKSLAFVSEQLSK